MSANEPDDALVDQLLAEAFRAPASPAATTAAPRDPAGAAAIEISSRYLVDGEIGRGGVGIVLRGRDLELGRDVAIKILKAEHRGHEGLTRRFVEEAQIGGQLEHPGIVPVHEMGRAPDGRPFFAMKLVQGRTLAELLKSRRDAADDRTRLLQIYEQICQTVAYAHARGVIHRDLKPANVILGAFGEVQVADWGLAKVIGRPEPAEDGATARAASGSSAISTARTSSSELLSQAGSVLGTLAYMPPEQARGESEKVDARSDVFALGAMLCEILTAAPPYVGDSTEIFDAARAASLGPALARLDRCGADPELIALARRCLAAEPASRPGDASAVAEAIATHRAALQERARTAELAAAAASARASEERRARRLTLALAATVLLAVLLGGAVHLKTERERGERQEQAAGPVRAELGRARELAAAARRVEGDALQPWRAALAAAGAAVTAAGAGDPGQPLRDEAAALHAELAAEVARAEAIAATRARDDATVRELASLAGKMGVWPWDELDAAFTDAFRRWGLDYETMTDDETVARLRASSDPVRICDFLMAWMGVRAGLIGRNEAPRDFERMMRTMQLADPDPWRVRIRGAIPDRVGELASLVDDPQIWTLEPRTISFLGGMLGRSQFGDHMEDALRLLRTAADRFPQEYTIRINLASWLGSAGVGRFGEAIEHASAAVAIAPEMAGAWLVLGWAREGVGEFEEAIAAFDRAMALDARSVEPITAKAIAQLRIGRTDDAIVTLRGALEKSPGSDELRHGLALAQLQAGDVDAARAGFTALARTPKELRTVTRAADWLLLIGDPGAVTAAEEAMQAALRSANKTTPINTILELRTLLVAALLVEGRFDQALAELRINELLLASPGRFALPIANVQAVAALADDLSDFATGAREPASPLEAARVALLLERGGTTAFAAELWRDALAHGDAAVLEDMPLARLYGARAAMRAAAGDGDDAKTLPAATRSRYRAEALGFVREELDHAVQDDALDPSASSRDLIEHLLLDPALIPVRDPARRAALPADEARAWEEFFDRARAALRRVGR